MTKKKKKGGYDTPDVIREILDSRRGVRGYSKDIDFSLNVLTNELRPRKLPSLTGRSTVAVLKGNAPTGQDNNTIREVMDSEEHRMVKQWLSTYSFYVGQLVVFHVSDITYTFQIRATDKTFVGEFILVSKVSVEQQPGVWSRTYKTGGSKSSYSR